MENKRMLGLTGSMVLCLGVFCPVLLVPMLGRINYFILGKGDGTVIIALALISFLLTLKKKYKALWYTGLGSFGIIIFTFLSTYGVPGAARPVTTHLSASWGWVVLLLGAGTLSAAAAITAD